MPEPIPVNFRIHRAGTTPESERQYTVDVRPGMTVLDALLNIRDTQDASLTWRFSCRMGICGSCAMVINGKPGLACNTQILEISGSDIHLQPLANFPVVKDLVVNLNPMFEKHRAVKTYIVREAGSDDAAPEGDYEQKPAELLEFLQFTDCIKCGACMSACPTLAMDERFLGPMPLTAVHRYNADSRDNGFSDRRQSMSQFHDPAHCHYAAECSRVCPKGVDPAKAIQLLKRSLVADALYLRSSKGQAGVLAPGTPRNEAEVPGPPSYTVNLKEE